MTPAQRRILEVLASGEAEDIIGESKECWVGNRRTSWGAVYALLRLMAIADVSDSDRLRRYVINETGRALLRRPELEKEIRLAIAGRDPFTIIEDRVRAIS